MKKSGDLFCFYKIEISRIVTILWRFVYDMSYLPFGVICKYANEQWWRHMSHWKIMSSLKPVLHNIKEHENNFCSTKWLHTENIQILDKFCWCHGNQSRNMAHSNHVAMEILLLTTDDSTLLGPQLLLHYDPLWKC